MRRWQNLRRARQDVDVPFSGTLYGDLESAGAAGGVVDLSVGVLGWPIFGVGYAWSVGAVFPEIKKVLASFSLCRCE